MKKAIILIFLASVISLHMGLSSPAGAVSAGDWRAGNIISDSLFFRGNAMSVSDIQVFLNAQVPVCDTWGNKMHSSGVTRAQYGTSVGAPPPYICVKDYHENPTTHETNFNPNAAIPAGAKSAAQIIYDASVRYNINPRVILVTIKKEAAENLLGDDWPWMSQYRSALGYGCPDTAPCDAEYYGFYNQVENAARQFRRYATYPQEYRYKAGYVNFIQYNPNAACSGTNVFIETQATAGLYNYTPYQPNAAALANMYGTGDGCSAYGNRNFWRIWSDWFGSTVDDRLFYRVMRGDQAGEVYLQTSQGKYYVPSYDLLAEWGLGPNNVVVVPQAEANAIPTRSNLSNALTDGSGRLYLVEGGGIHEVTSPNHTVVWGVDTSKIVESLGLSYDLPTREPLGRFMQVRNGDGSIWLADGGYRHSMPNNSLLYAWGYYPGITTTVSPYFFNRYAAKHDVTQFASTDGVNAWAIDASTKRPFKNQQAQAAYLGQTAPTQVNQSVLNLLASDSALTIFTINNNTRQWFIVDNGQKRYIPKGELAALWGKPDTEPFTLLSNNFMSGLPTGSDVSYVARSPSNATYWLIAKAKHPIPNGNIYTSISGSTASPEVYSDSLINSLPTGRDASNSISSTQSPYNYSYLLDNGARRYPATPSAQQAWLVNTLSVPYQLMSVIPEKSFITSTVVKDASGQAYYVEGGIKYPVSTDLSNDWGVTNSTPQIISTTLNNYPIGPAVEPIIRSVSGGVFVISEGKKIPANKHGDTITTLATSLPINLNGLSGANELSFLITSSENSDNSMWLISNGEKIPLPLFEQRVALGYLSNSVQPTRLSQSVLDKIPVSQVSFSNLLQKPGSGIKFLNFGHSLGFPDGPTLIAHMDADRPILQVSPSVFDSIPLQGSVSRLVFDDAGRYWWIENGHRRYINSWDAYHRHGYPNLPARYLFGTTMNLIPIAATIQ